MNRSKYFNYISDKLNEFASLILLRGSFNLLDYHIHSERFFRDFFNMLFDLKLVKTADHNEPGIDLVDENNRIVVSVSSTSTKDKIERSLKKVNPKYSGYKFKFISISKDADQLKTKSYSNPHNLMFEPAVDIYDIQTLLGLILEMEIDPLGNIFSFIKNELGGGILSQELKPIDSLKDYLTDIENWKEIETEDIGYYYELHPEFKIITNSDFHEKYEEPWCSRFYRPESSLYEYFVKYQDTMLSTVCIVGCNGARFFTAVPSIWLRDSTTDYFYSYYLIKDSIEYLVGELIQEKIVAANLSNSLIDKDIRIFESEELARQSIDDDFSNNGYEYIYYSFDKKTQVYSRIVGGDKEELPLRWLQWWGNLKQLQLKSMFPGLL
ncbi:MAG: SMEK domain-containing protein [Methylovulum sp.]|nr:SMEK domain-containing protein [Methylovulum sp.]